MQRFNKKVIVLEQNLVCYKIARRVFNGYESAYQGGYIPFGKFAPCEEFDNKIQRDLLRDIIGEGAYHLLREKNDALLILNRAASYMDCHSEYVVLKCIIPAGTKVIHGTFIGMEGNYPSIVSETYLAVEEIKINLDVPDCE